MKPLSVHQTAALKALAERSGSDKTHWAGQDIDVYRCNICNKILSMDFVYSTESQCNILIDVINHGNEHLKSLNIFI